MFDVLIVGGGIAGLHTAWRLEAAGRSVVLLEARDRVGGRLLSHDGALDLGASWIWPSERRVMALARELDVATFAQYSRGHLLYDVKGSDVQAVPVGEPAMPSLRVRGGTAALAHAVAQRLAPGTVRCGSAAVSIDDGSDGSLTVHVEGQSPEHAEHVVLALPPALALQHMTFDSPLPSQLERVARETPVWMGSIVKTVVVFARPFWRAAGCSGTAMSNAGPLQEVHDHCGPDGRPAALFGFTSVGAGHAEAPLKDAVLRQLVRLFGPEAAEPLEFLQRDWSRSSATSPPGVGQLDRYDLFGHPVLGEAYLDGRLHFASCETAGSQGHIEDALAASERTVARITG